MNQCSGKMFRSFLKSQSQLIHLLKDNLRDRNKVKEDIFELAGNNSSVKYFSLSNCMIIDSLSSVTL